MKRERNRCGYAAALFDKTIKRLDCFGVPKDYGDLTALGAEGGLPLRAGFGLGHGSLLRGVQLVPLLHMGDATLGDFKAGPAVLNNAVHVDVEQAVGVGFDLELGAGGQVLHDFLRVGPIPTMCLSYTVTSDNATTVRREIAA